MKHLKKYNEHDFIPNNFIRLDSIGHVLDPEDGVLYAMWKKGGYDSDNPYEVECFLNYHNTIDGISDEEMEIVSKYWKSCESITKDRINWDLIQSAKDISLEYLDEGNELVIEVVITEENDNYFGKTILLTAYEETFSHNDDVIKWEKYFPRKINIIKDNPLAYRFTIRPKKGLSKQWGLINWEPKLTRELREHLTDMFPNEILINK